MENFSARRMALPVGPGFGRTAWVDGACGEQTLVAWMRPADHRGGPPADKG